MRNEIIIESWDKIKPGDATHERILNNILVRVHSGGAQNRKADNMAKKTYWKILVPIAACVIAAVAIAIPFLNKSGGSDDNGGGFGLVRSNGVSVAYIDDPPAFGVEADLVYLTEEELFSDWEGLERVIFEGEVKKVENIVLSFGGGWDEGGFEDYRAIAHIEACDVYRGGIEPGATVTVLLPSPVGDSDKWMEDSHISSQMTVGTKGIFLPVRYNETSVWEQNGDTLYLQELAEYCMLDGERHAFLEKPQGVAFDRDAYEGVSGATTMDEIRRYVVAMLASAP